MFISVPRTTPLSPRGRGGGGAGGVKIDEESQTEHLYFLFPRKYIFRYFKYKIQKNNYSCEKGHVICLTGASGPQWEPKNRGRRAKIAIIKHYLL